MNRSACLTCAHQTGIQDLTEYRGEEPLLRWSAYKQVTNADVVLSVWVKSQLGSLRTDISLIDAAVTFMDEARRRLNLPKARDVFEISNKEELEEAICNVSRSLLARYVSVLPQTLYESLNQAGNDSVRGYPLRRGFPQSGWIGFFVGGVPTWPNYLADSVMEGDVRQLIHKTPHVRYTFARERRSRDGHHVAVGPHHLADDFSLHARDAGQPPQGGGLSGSQRASKASIGERQRQKRAKIAPTRYWNGRDVSV